MREPHRVAFGPNTIETVPYSHFTQLRRRDLESAWQIVGPTVARNIDKPLWAQFCAAYLEGLNHGSGIERERLAPPVTPPPPPRERKTEGER